jgi:hypothetical protein
MYLERQENSEQMVEFSEKHKRAAWRWGRAYGGDCGDNQSQEQGEQHGRQVWSSGVRLLVFGNLRGEIGLRQIQL